MKFMKSLTFKPQFPDDMPDSIKEATSNYTFEVECNTESAHGNEFPITLFTQYNDTHDYDSIFYLSKDDAKKLIDILYKSLDISIQYEFYNKNLSSYMKKLENWINRKEVKEICLHFSKVHTLSAKLASEQYIYDCIINVFFKDDKKENKYFKIREIDLNPRFSFIARTSISSKNKYVLSRDRSGDHSNFDDIIVPQIVFAVIGKLNIDLDMFDDKTNEFDHLFSFIDFDKMCDIMLKDVLLIYDYMNERNKDLLKTFDTALENGNKDNTIRFLKPNKNEEISNEILRKAAEKIVEEDKKSD